MPKSTSTRNGLDAHGDALTNGSSSQPSRSEWLIGEALDKALQEDDADLKVEVRWPFAPTDDKVDWEGREVVLYVYLVCSELTLGFTCTRSSTSSL